MCCYVVAKNVDSVGCIAIKMKPGSSVVSLKRELEREFGHQKLQFVTISRPSAYGEYEPYRFVDTPDEFKRGVRQL